MPQAEDLETRAGPARGGSRKPGSPAHAVDVPPCTEPSASSSSKAEPAQAEDMAAIDAALEALRADDAVEPGAAGSGDQPAPKATAAASSDGRKKLVTEETFPIWRLGSIRYNPRSKTYSAYCGRHENCEKTRACNEPGPRSSNPGQGRPLGFLLAWLKEQNQRTSAYEHVHSTLAHLQYETRRASRISFRSLPNADHFARRERPKRSGEDDEPRIIS